MKRQTFAVIGLGRFGATLATTLMELGHDVIGIDRDEERVRSLADTMPHVMQLDATDERALRAAGIHEVDVAVISIGENIESSVLAVMLVRELGIRTIVAKAVTPLHGRILQRLGVSRILFPERDMAVRLAHTLVVPNVLDFIELSRDFSIVELPAPAEFTGQTLRELALRPRFGLTLIAIKRKAEGVDHTTVAPTADDRVQAGDVLALLGPNDRLAKLDAMFRK